jgi:hypothetical protein
MIEKAMFKEQRAKDKKMNHSKFKEVGRNG